ncbi:hypothetical protein BS47DRAFT_194860 [Hydnum rufescens UP504]|uniref:Uncharacterized protein n=1 Tax=Hydnum rufescens UP504 TaxID=1448309 RepID=A0A9P6DYR8_9AGAM|nr:hypothetical protein BS47DRAFT_194860 [Hydnum rufescens UP504]
MSPAPRTPQPESADAVSIPDHPIHLNLMHPLNMPPLPSLSSSTTSRPWNSVDSRGAWIVPLVGPALHSTGTPASTLASRSLLPPAPDTPSAVMNPNTSTASMFPAVPPATRPLVEQIRILWTPESLPQFWSLLIRIRKKAVLGPIGFSLEREDLVNLIKHEHLPHPQGPSLISSSHGSVSAHPSGGRHRAGKQTQRHEWIKIYCESRYALRLRTILEHFRAVESFEGPSSSAGVKGRSNADHGVSEPASALATGDSKVDERSRKILLGTKLVFVDDLGRPAIVS